MAAYNQPNMYPQNSWGYSPAYGVGTNGTTGYSTNSINTPGNTYTQSPLNNIMVVPVVGQEAAESYPVAIGLTVMLLDYNNGIFWLKSNDGINVKLVKHVFSIENTPKEQAESKDEFVTKKEFNSLCGKVDSLLKNLGENED